MTVSCLFEGRLFKGRAQSRAIVAQVLDLPIQSFQAQANLIRVARGCPTVLINQSIKSWVVFGWSEMLFERFRVIRLHGIRVLQPSNKLLFDVRRRVHSCGHRLWRFEWTSRLHR